LFLDEFTSYINAGAPLIFIETPEEKRCVDQIKALEPVFKKEGYGVKIRSWSVTTGYKGTPEEADPYEALKEALKFEEFSLTILVNFGPFIQDPSRIQMVKDLAELGRMHSKTIVIVSSTPFSKAVPEPLHREFVVLDFPFPTKEELKESFEKIVEDNRQNSPNFKIKVSKTDIEKAADSALGLTLFEADRALSRSLTLDKKPNPQRIRSEKVQILKKTQLLDFFSPNDSMQSVGGLNNLKDWLRKRRSGFSEKAKKFGLPSPKGVLLIGVPGCGKSLIAKAIASDWELPLLRFDIGKVFGSLVGQSEDRVRQAINLADALAPCILWIDEMEKGLSGLQSSGVTDSGVTARVFGTILTWMGEKTSSVFVAATANAVYKLPPELLRKGRFDEIFFIDLPTEKERDEIFRIHLKKRKRDVNTFDIKKLATYSKGFSGAEIEGVIVDSLFDAFSENKHLNTEYILKALRHTVPLNRTMRENIDGIRQWASERARLATIEEVNQKVIEEGLTLLL